MNEKLIAEALTSRPRKEDGANVLYLEGLIGRLVRALRESDAARVTAEEECAALGERLFIINKLAKGRKDEIDVLRAFSVES